jgi:hypothetical protein
VYAAYSPAEPIAKDGSVRNGWSPTAARLSGGYPTGRHAGDQNSQPGLS